MTNGTAFSEGMQKIAANTMRVQEIEVHVTLTVKERYSGKEYRESNHEIMQTTSAYMLTHCDFNELITMMFSTVDWKLYEITGQWDKQVAEMQSEMSKEIQATKEKVKNALDLADAEEKKESDGEEEKE